MEAIRRDNIKGLRMLGRDRALMALESGTRYYARKGVKAFQSDWTSTTEAAAIWRVEHGPDD